MTEEILDIEITGERLHRVLALVKNYSDGMALSDWDFYKGGIRIYSMDAKTESLIQIAIGKKYFEEYKCSKELFMGIDDIIIGDLMDICRLAAATKMSIKVSKNLENIRIKYGNVNRRIKMPTEERSREKQDTTTNVYPKSKVLGELKIEELKLFMRASATWQGDPNRTTTITKKKKAFEISTEIYENQDNIILKLDKILKKQFKGDKLKIILMSQKLNNAIQQIDRIAGTVTLRGNTNFPVIIMKHDEKPEDMLKFKHDLNFWYLIAPRVEQDD